MINNHIKNQLSAVIQFEMNMLKKISQQLGKTHLLAQDFRFQSKSTKLIQLYINDFKGIDEDQKNSLFSLNSDLKEVGLITLGQNGESIGASKTPISQALSDIVTRDKATEWIENVLIPAFNKVLGVPV
jgi:GH35 family endo-1,4-beta-xylanase